MEGVQVALWVGMTLAVFFPGYALWRGSREVSLQQVFDDFIETLN